MNIDIRKSIIKNFENTDTSEIKTSIEDSIDAKEEITLPGLGVFFELLWNNSDNTQKEKILEIIKKSLQ